MIDKVGPTTGFYLQHYACLHKYTQWGSTLCEAPVFCNFFKRFKKPKRSFTHLFCETFPPIFSHQWPLFTAPSPASHMWISISMEHCLEGGCLQAAAFPRVSGRLKEGFSCLHLLHIWKVYFANRGPGKILLYFSLWKHKLCRCQTVNPWNWKKFPSDCLCLGNWVCYDPRCLWGSSKEKELVLQEGQVRHKSVIFLDFFFFFRNLVKGCFSMISETFQRVCFFFGLLLHTSFWSTKCLNAFLKNLYCMRTLKNQRSHC